MAAPAELREVKRGENFWRVETFPFLQYLPEGATVEDVCGLFREQFRSGGLRVGVRILKEKDLNISEGVTVVGDKRYLAVQFQVEGEDGSHLYCVLPLSGELQAIGGRDIVALKPLVMPLSDDEGEPVGLAGDILAKAGEASVRKAKSKSGVILRPTLGDSEDVEIGRGLNLIDSLSGLVGVDIARALGQLGIDRAQVKALMMDLELLDQTVGRLFPEYGSLNPYAKIGMLASIQQHMHAMAIRQETNDLEKARLQALQAANEAMSELLKGQGDMGRLSGFMRPGARDFTDNKLEQLVALGGLAGIEKGRLEAAVQAVVVARRDLALVEQNKDLAKHGLDQKKALLARENWTAGEQILAKAFVDLRDVILDGVAKTIKAVIGQKGDSENDVEPLGLIGFFQQAPDAILEGLGAGTGKFIGEFKTHANLNWPKLPDGWRMVAIGGAGGAIVAIISSPIGWIVVPATVGGMAVGSQVSVWGKEFCGWFKNTKWGKKIVGGGEGELVQQAHSSVSQEPIVNTKRAARLAEETVTRPSSAGLPPGMTATRPTMPGASRPVSPSLGGGLPPVARPSGRPADGEDEE